MADTIDINVYETTEEVNINVTPTVIEVNINKVTSTGAVTSVNGQTGDVTIAVSDNNFTNTLKTKLDGISAGAEVNVNADWNASTGDAQILNKPTIPASQVNSDWNATSGVAQILNKPTLTGYGDMFKSTYDVDNTGVVDNAEAIKIIGRNSTGSTLYRGTVVYLNGATGNRPNFAKAQANAESTSAGTFGVITDDLANNTDGYCIALGYLDNLDTRSTATNPFTTDTLSAGDTIYLSPSTAGYITNVKPSAPNHLVYLGKVTRTSPTNGTIVYRIQNGYELEELHNVDISSVADKQLLSYDNATSLWKNKSVTTSDIADSTNKRYVTDANLTTIGNTSGSNTGDQDLSGYVPTTRTVNAKALSANVTLTTADIADSTGKRYQTENQNTYNDATSSIQTQLGTKATDSLVVHLAGTETITGKKTLSPTVTASGAIAQGTILIPTLTAAANNDVLVGLDIQPTFNTGSFIGVTNYAARIAGNIIASANNIYDIGNSATRFRNIYASNDINSSNNVLCSNLWTNTIKNQSGTSITFTDSSANGIGRWYTNTGNLTIGGSTDITSAILQLTSTSKGFLPPRMTNAQRTSITSPAIGLMVYCTDTTEGVYVYKSTGWAMLL